MPIHDFRCLECGKVSEVLVRGTEQTLRCPDCGSANLERLISSSYVVKTGSQAPGTTCCGQTERCNAPPCSTGDTCRRH
ncbi:MAG: zinc ribbon domain-containing protein [Dehalococcoidia bacterium]|nr:MAG: zinc ribbon domain-containing protein [Dehalococcoidia bacterium]